MNLSNKASLTGGTSQPSTEAGATDKIMEQAQVFASSWSLVGGMFDNGEMIDTANEEKAELERMVRAALASVEAPTEPWMRGLTPGQIAEVERMHGKLRPSPIAEATTEPILGSIPAGREVEQSLAVMIVRLVRRMRKVKPDDDLAATAYDYVQRLGLPFSPLRAKVEAPTEPTQDLLWGLLDSVTEELNRCAAPGVYLTKAWAAGAKFINGRPLCAPAQAIRNGEVTPRPTDEREATPEQVEALDDLVTMVRRLVRALHKAAPVEPLTGLALDYLERKGFNKGPFRSAVVNPEPAQQAVPKESK